MMSVSPAPGRIGVIDIGSNSIRLAVFEDAVRAPVQLFNEKVFCALGKTVQQTGRLNPEGAEQAFATLARFGALLDGMGVAECRVVATAAVRDAQDGGEFLAALRERAGLSVSIISGEEEGRLSAQGVLSGTPDADGTMGDLGGGSLELVSLDRGQIGPRVTRPLGPFRLMTLGGGRSALTAAIDAQLDSIPWLEDGRGRDFYAVGGAWRAFATVHMAHIGYPLHIIHHYAIAADQAVEFAGLLARQSKPSLEHAAGISRRRIESLPYASLILERLLRRIGPRRLIFSAYGLREGIVFDRLPPAERQADPLLASCASAARRHDRFGDDALLLSNWTRPVLPADDARLSRLRDAACLLSDIGWLEHPDYRAEHAYLRVLRMPFGGIDHFGRAFLALAVHTRYAGASDGPIGVARDLLSERDRTQALILGLALRLAYTLTGGAVHLLAQSRLIVGRETLTLDFDPSTGVLATELVQRRLDALARAMGLSPQIANAGSRALAG